MKKRNRRHRHLQSQQQQERRRDARDVIQNTVVFVRQDLSYDSNDMPISVIVYDQQFVFDPTSSSTDDKERDDNAAALILTPMEIAKLPFNESDWNMRLGTALKENVGALKNIHLPLEIPIIPDQAQFYLTRDKTQNGRTTMSQGAIAGIFVAAATVFSGVALYALRQLDMATKPP